MSQIAGVRTNHRTHRHEQAKSGHGSHDVLAQRSHDSIGTGAMLENCETSEQNTDTDADCATHKGAHLEFIKVGRLLVLHCHGGKIKKRRIFQCVQEQLWWPPPKASICVVNYRKIPSFCFLAINRLHAAVRKF